MDRICVKIFMISILLPMWNGKKAKSVQAITVNPMLDAYFSWICCHIHACIQIRMQIKLKRRAKNKISSLKIYICFELMESSIVPSGIQITHKWNMHNIEKSKRKEKQRENEGSTHL